MLRKILRYSLLSIAGMVLAAASLAVELQIPADREVIVFSSSKLGNVTFHHKMHAELEDVGGVNKVECVTCHHDLEASGKIEDCHDCHDKKKGGKMKNAPSYKDAFHLRCRGCHKYTMETQHKDAGPDKKCKLCHIKEK
jgi:hypothetical protein